MAKARPKFTRNVCGLLFTQEDPPQVVLSRRVVDDVAVYDGLGGEMRPDSRPEGPQVQLSELVYAETGVLTPPEAWTEIVTLKSDLWEVMFFFTQLAEAINCRSQGASKLADDVGLEDPLRLPDNLIPTIRWLVPLAMDDTVVKPLGLSGIEL